MFISLSAKVFCERCNDWIAKRIDFDPVAGHDAEVILHILLAGLLEVDILVAGIVVVGRMRVPALVHDQLRAAVRPEKPVSELKRVIQAPNPAGSCVRLPALVDSLQRVLPGLFKRGPEQDHRAEMLVLVHRKAFQPIGAPEFAELERQAVDDAERHRLQEAMHHWLILLEQLVRSPLQVDRDEAASPDDFG